MPQQAGLKELLKEETPRARAAWYAVLCGDSKRWEQKCRDFMVGRNAEKKVLETARILSGNRKAWEKELRGLKDELIEKVRQEAENTSSLAEIEGEKMVEWACILGALLAPDLKMAQVRRVLGSIMHIEAAVQREGPQNFKRAEAEYLRVYLAYAAGRKEEARPLLAVLEPLIQRVREGGDGWSDFRILTRFVRAIVAYHKFFGGGE